MPSVTQIVVIEGLHQATLHRAKGREASLPLDKGEAPTTFPGSGMCIRRFYTRALSSFISPWPHPMPPFGDWLGPVPT